MNNNRSITFFILCTLTLLACSTSNHTKIFTPIATGNEKSVVYIYRPTVMTNAIYSPDLLVNDEFKFSLKTGKKYLLSLPPGETTFEIEPDKAYSGITQLKLPLKSSKRYYLRIDTTLKINKSITYKAYQRGFSLVRVDEESAVAEMVECCSKKTKDVIKHVAAESTSEKNSAGDNFSIDKTQNPFSH